MMRYLIMLSPCPVVLAAPRALSAYNPLPGRGLSPTRPLRFMLMPPVLVAAATFPWASQATAPTVSWPACALLLPPVKIPPIGAWGDFKYCARSE